MNGDLISRDELLKKECCGRISGDDVRNAPAIDAAPVVHGRWGDYVCVGYNGLKSVWARPCSECGYENQAFATKYCPNCGSKMDLEE